MRRLLTSVAALSALGFGSAHAGVGVDGSLGTTGFSAHVHYDVIPMVTVRAGFNYLEFELDDEEYDGVSYDTELDFTQFGLYADLHPIPAFSGFTVTAGYVFGERSIDLVSTPTEPVEVGDQVFTPDQVGSLLGNGDFGSGGFYTGIGWDKTTRGLSPIGLVVRAGVIISDSPNISLRSQGGLADNDPQLRATLDAELAREAESVNDDIDGFRFYPVLSVGIGFGF